MNTSRIVPGAVVAGLAVAAALVTANFIRAAENAASVSATVGQTMLSAPSPAGLPFASVGGPDFVASFAAFGRDFDWVYHVSAPFIFADHVLIIDPNPVRDLPREAGPEARTINPGQEIETVSTDADTATEAARNQADVDALFAVAVRVKPARVETAKDAQGERGKRVYMDLCFACHQPDGQGLPGVFPVLAKSDYMAADRTRAIRIVLEGLAGPVTVNGETINSVMPAQKTVLTDEQIADVLTYAYNAWENPGGTFTTSQVEAIRNEKLRN